ncbi:MAG: hypothetical protein HY534_02065 [Chloroflexi bacterium]|nr:hypothetical protein [Chloroflexota bacterium]
MVKCADCGLLALQDRRMSPESYEVDRRIRVSGATDMAVVCFAHQRDIPREMEEQRIQRFFRNPSEVPGDHSWFDLQQLLAQERCCPCFRAYHPGLSPAAHTKEPSLGRRDARG